MTPSRLIRRLKRFVEKNPKPSFPSVDLRSRGLTSLEAYYEEAGEPCIVEVPLAHCRWVGPTGFTYGAGTGHPYVRTLLECRRGESTRFEGSYLQRYWDAWKPLNLAESFGIDPGDCHRFLRDSPPLHRIDPWSGTYAAEWLEHRLWLKKAKTRELFEGGFAPARSSGPMPVAFGIRRFDHLVKILRVIERDGYRREAPVTLPYGEQHIVGVTLARGSDSRTVVVNGQHRAAAAIALGQETVPVLVHVRDHMLGASLVRREDAERWPLVRAGIFSLDQALAVFDRIFAGEQPDRLRRVDRELQDGEGETLTHAAGAAG